MCELPNFALRLLEKVAVDEGFSNYRIETEAGSKNGDGFMGIMVSCKIIGDRTVNSIKTTDTLQVLSKIAPTNADRRREFHSALAFPREVCAYQAVLPTFIEFQREKGIPDAEGFNAVAKCYAAVADVEKEEFALIMEDLRLNDYVVLPKAQPTISENAYLVVEQLAKYHAISFALKDQRPDVYNGFRFGDDIVMKFIKTSDVLFKSTFKRAMAAVKNPRHIEILQECLDRFDEMFESHLAEGLADPYDVIIHGDLWNNNMLFKQTTPQSNRTKHVCFVDWQVIRFVSPVTDLLYAIFIGSDKDFRQKEHQRLIKFYYDTLSTQIRRLGSDPDNVYPYSVFQEHLKRFAVIIFMLGPLMAEVMVADSATTSDLDEVSTRMTNGDKDVSLVGVFNEETQQRFKTRVDDLLNDLIEFGYYWE